VIVDGHGIKGGRATFTDTQSSQYVSAVLISAPYARGDVEVKLEGTTSSMPYIDMTIETMRTFGVDVLKKGEDTYAVGANQRYKNVNYVVESDASSASYFFLAAALCGGKVRILNMNPDTLQGDMGFIKILEQSGCRVTRGADWIEVAGGKLEPGDYDFDMSGMPDIVPTLAVLAAFRPGRTSIKNVAHLRIKESNRIEALVNELKRTGIEAKETEDGLVIEGGTPHGAEIRTYDDHRIAMSFAVAGLVTEGMKIENHECVNKSFPEFWETLDRLYK
jgi:3-phosphoshikimate 1-carboxyvinyltransferase